jgi:hypothetical protein
MSSAPAYTSSDYHCIIKNLEISLNLQIRDHSKQPLVMLRKIGRQFLKKYNDLQYEKYRASRLRLQDFLGTYYPS